MDFDFSISSLAAGFVFGVFGVYLLKWGRKTANVLHMLLGLVLIIYPYFISTPWLLWGLGTVILAVAYRYR